MIIPLRCYLLTFCLLLGLALTLQAQGKDAPRPNIIFILVDDMGWGDMGVLHQNKRKAEGKPSIDTPKLDTMANEGIQLRRHYSGAPVCAPSRASLFLGVHQGHVRTVRNNTFDMPIENSHTLGSVLKEAGYATAIIGKWGIGGGRESGGGPNESTAFPSKRGFDYFFGYMDHIAGHRHYPKEDKSGGVNGITSVWDQDKVITQDCDHTYSTDLFTARAKQWIIDEHKNSPKKPFFLALTLTAPHAALQVPTMPYPKGAGLHGGLQWTGKSGAIINTAQGTNDSFIYPQYATKDWPESAKRHATMITRIDDAVGDIMALLKDLNIAQNTLVVFTSDNGAHNESSFLKFTQDPNFFESYGPLDGIKRDVWEGGFRVPALVHWPQGIPAGIKSHTPSQFHDWMATFAELAGVPIPARTDGVSLVPTLTQKGKQAPGLVYTEYTFPGKTPQYNRFLPQHKGALRHQEQVIFHKGYKGLRRDIKSENDSFEIYDTLNDLQEAKNLAESSDEFKKLQEEMKAEVLRNRRVYTYVNNVRGNTCRRPYDTALVPSLAPSDKKDSLITQFTLLSKKATPWTPKTETMIPLSQEKESLGTELPSELPEEFTGEWLGTLDIPEDGLYEFELIMEDNPDTKGFVHLHHIQLIDGDKETYLTKDKDLKIANSSTIIGCTELKKEVKPNLLEKAIPLQSGKHPIRIGYVHGKGPNKPSVKLVWKKLDLP